MATNDYFGSHYGQTVPFLTTDVGTPYCDENSEPSSTNSPLDQNNPETPAATSRRSSSYRTSQTYICHLPTTDPYQMQGSVPIELQIENLYGDLDRRRKRSVQDKDAPSPVHSRRRAQNRASQRAFRDRKEKHVKEVEQRLQELEVKHSDLTLSYEALQTEYQALKQELERLTRDDVSNGALSSLGVPYNGNYLLPKDAELDCSLWDELIFNFGEETGGGSQPMDR